MDRSVVCLHRLRRLERNPTLKAELTQITAANEPLTVGFSNHPVGQVADILPPRAHRGHARDHETFNRPYQETFTEP
jgi:tryptophanyl-tRNA synthetase